MPKDTDKWEAPTEKHGKRWNGFLMSSKRYSIAGRHKAKCLHCSAELDGKPTLLFKHIKEKCKSISKEDRSTYITYTLQENKTPSNNTEDQAVTSTTKQPLSQPQFVYSFQKASLHNFSGTSKEKTDELHQLLLKALISGHIPLRFLQNRFFQEYQKRLCVTTYKIPSRYIMMDRILPHLHAQHEISVQSQLSQQKNLTISLDGWTDCSRNSIYAVLVLRGTQVKQFLDVLDLHQERHTSENIWTALKKSLDKKSIDWQQISAVVSDSPSVMIKFRKLVIEAHPHIFGLACCLHAFNLIAKDILGHPLMKDVASNNKMLVNFFTSSAFWAEHLAKWRKQEKIAHGLQTACETRWFSMAKVCLCVEEHELGFRRCVAMLDDRTIDTPAINKNVRSIVNNRDHFTSNQVLVKVLRPVVDAIARLECANTTVGDVWLELATVYCQLQKIDLHMYPRFTDFKQHCLNVLHQQSKVYEGDIYIIGFFLNPSCRQIAVSREFSVEKMTRMIVNVAQSWGFSKSDALSLKDQVPQYYNGNDFFPSFKQDEKPMDYWLRVKISSQTNQLKKLAIWVLELVAHAGGVEGLFSDMAATKTKNRNRMDPDTLRMFSQVGMGLYCEESSSKKSSSLASSQDPVVESNSDKEFDGPDALEEFEAGVFPISMVDQVEGLLDPTLGLEDGYIDTLFDLSNFENRQIRVNEPQTQDIIVIDGPSKSWDLEDIF